MIKLYENIKLLRKENGWSQDELAKRMGYTDRSSIAKIEAGQVDLSESKIMAFAKVFNVNPPDLMGYNGVDIMESTSPKIDGRDAEFIDLYLNATPELRQAALAVLKSAKLDS